jgi:hypothetical protein
MPIMNKRMPLDCDADRRNDMETADAPIIGPAITALELRDEMARYEAVYQMTTERFLVRYDNPDDPMEDVEDASFWHLAYVALLREDEAADQPPPWLEELADERGPEKALVLL